MSYKSVVSLAPTIPQGIDDHLMGEILRYCNQRFRTLAWSIDDALNLVNGEDASPESLVEIWNAKTRLPHELERILQEAPNITWMNYPGISEPHLLDLVDILPRQGEWSKRDLGTVWMNVIHHTVGWNYSKSNQDNAVIIALSHIGRGWVSAGYHFLIAPDGEIMKLNRINEISYHAAGSNDVSVGIALGGDFRNVPPSEPQIFSAASLVSWLRFLPLRQVVFGHKQTPGASTVCPGYEIDDWMKRIDGTWELVQ